MQNKLKNWLKEIRDYCVIKRSGLFDCEYYLHNNLDVARSCVNPIMHYIRHGRHEGRNPSKFFDTKWYLKSYADVQRAGINPLYHYLKYGAAENRAPSPKFSNVNNQTIGLKDQNNLSPTGIKKIQMDDSISNKALLEIKPQYVVRKKEVNETIDISYTNSSGLISIIIPVYNTEKNLSNLLDSIIQQTYNNLEVVIVDDGSENKKEVFNIAQKYEHKLDLYFYHLDKNHGANYARNYGFSKSRGEFLFFCDSDVILAENIFEKMLQRMHIVPSISWIYCNYLLGNRKLRFNPFDGNRLNRFNFCSTMSLIRRSSFPGFDVAIKRYQDWDLFLTIYENGGSGEWIDEFLFYVEDRHDGITNSNAVTDYEARIILKKKHKKVAVV